MNLQDLFQSLDERKEEMFSIRRHLHQYPELSFKETETAKYIAAFYEGKDATVQTGVGGNGIKVTIDSGKPGRTVAIRADFDAIPIQEETGLPFASVNAGVMHACGHDAHTAYMMILADELIKRRKELTGKIVVIHQHAEEMPPGGSKAMIEDGVLDGVDNVFGIHVINDFAMGDICYHHGPTQQARAKFTITLKGVGGHGSSPHTANDSIVAASHLVVALQTIVSRRLSPFENGVVTIGSFEGDGAFNVIRDSVTIAGDVRAMADSTRQKIEEQIRAIATGIAQTFQMGIVIDYQNDYPVLDNDREMTDLVIKAVTEANIDGVKNIRDCGQMPPSEDFAYYAKERPSCYFYVGARLEDKPFPHHHPKFDLDENSMLIAAKAMAAVVYEYLGTEG